MKIDSHHHIWDLDVTKQDWIIGEALAPINRNYSLTDFRDATKGLGIDKSVLVQTVTNYEETPLLLEIAAADDLVAGVVGWLDVSASDAIKHLDEYEKSAGAKLLKGIRDIVQDNPDPDYLARPQVEINIKEIGRRGLAFDLLTKTPELPGAIELVKKNPEVQFVLDHISKPYIAKQEFEPWRTLINEIAKFENVVCKVSGIVTEADWHSWSAKDVRPYLDIVLNAFGANRLMYGSDWPVLNLAGDYEKVHGLASDFVATLSSGEQSNFWYGCANVTYKLSI